MLDEEHLRVEVHARVFPLHPPLIDLRRVDVRRHDDELLVGGEHLDEFEQEEFSDARVELC